LTERSNFYGARRVLTMRITAPIAASTAQAS
jgi:hypothetical protein